MVVRSRALAGVLVAVLWLASACSHAPATATVRFDQASCPDDVADPTGATTVTCGLLTVPERHAAPNGPSIRVFIARFAPAGSTQKDPMLVIGGTDLGAQVDYSGDIVPLVSRVGREVIVIEPRGTGHGEPALTCPEIDTVDKEHAGASFLDNAMAEAFLSAVTTCRSRLEASGVDPAAYDLSEAAADVADLQSALGVDSWNLATYGPNSVIAFEVLRRSPAGLRSAFMDSPAFPGRSAFRVEIDGLTAAIDSIGGACGEQPSCARVLPDLPGTVAEILARAQANPTTATSDGGSVTIDAATVARSVRDFLVSTPSAVPSVVRDLAKGNDGDVVSHMAGARATCVGYRVSCAASDDGTALGEVLSVLCMDEASTAGVAALQAGSPMAGLEDAYLHNPWLAVCDSWTSSVDAAETTTPVTSDVPVLLLHGALDPTSVAPSSEDLGGLSAAYAYEFPAQSFNVLGAGPADCARDIRAAFVDDPGTEPGSQCIDRTAPPVLL